MNKLKTVAAGASFVVGLTCLTYLVMAMFACFVAWTPEYLDVTAWHPYARGTLGFSALMYVWIVIETITTD